MNIIKHIIVLAFSLFIAFLLHTHRIPSSKNQKDSSTVANKIGCVYTFPVWYISFTLMAFFVPPVLLMASKELQTLGGFIVLGLMWLGTAYALLVVISTRVILTEDEMLFTSIFRKTRMKLASIQSVVECDWDQSYKITDSARKNLRLSYYMGGIDELMNKIRHRTSG